MKRILSTALLAMSCCFANASAWTLSESAIILADDSDAARAAAEELASHLKLVSGADIPVVTNEISASSGKFQFIVGRAAPDCNEQPKAAEARYAIRGNRAYLWGDNTRWFNGILNAADFLLERRLNIKWIRPGARGTVWKEQQQVTLPEREDFAWELPYEKLLLRSGELWAYNQASTLMVPEALRPSAAECLAKQREESLWVKRLHHGFRSYFNSGHAFTDWWKRYGKTHPEYFGLNEDGTRGPKSGGKEPDSYSHFCVSNPSVADQVVANWVAAGKPKYFNVCPNDGPFSWCRCPECMALDTRPEGEDFFTNLSDRELYFWNRIAERAVKLRKDVVLVAYIYSIYRLPPRRERVEYPDNMLFGVVPVPADDNEKLFGAWNKLGARHFWLRPNDLAHYVEYYRGQDEHIYRKYQQARKFDIIGVDYDGSPGNRAADFEYFMVGRMMAFPERSFEAIEDEYCSVYGAAAAQVKDFFRFQRQCEERRRRAAAADLEKQPQAKETLVKNFGYDSRVNHNANNVSALYTDEEMLKGEQILQSGLKENLAPEERIRLKDMLSSQQHARLVLAAIQARELKLGSDCLKTAARKLLDFRIAHREELDMNWGYFFNRERAVWADSGIKAP